ncbi:MAG: RNase adapter RapZ [Peptoniphilus sp.]|nr:RNase adapter RapZ [Peptoniphilus sp.]MDD7363257.1 RNase adapter RapZ [Bacillota bacterium]MDY6045350.1 RNase adapter RapZ [Peptoniphilus sp.]
MKLLVITGLSGAGKSQALKAAEDLGYYCVDNLPPALFPKFIDIVDEAKMPLVALALDIRSGLFFNELDVAIDTLDREVEEVTVIYLEADPHVLIQRFKELRRPHPLSSSIARGIEEERKRMKPMRARANYVIDTSRMTNHNLKVRLKTILRKERGKLGISILSFGFKNGILEEADLVFDVRFLPNPYYVPELKHKNGLNSATKDYVFGKKEGKLFIDYLVNYVKAFGDRYVEEGKDSLTIGIGCTGGFHRSVAVAEAAAHALEEEEYEVIVGHRDLRE